MPSSNHTDNEFKTVHITSIATHYLKTAKQMMTNLQ